MTSPHHQPKVEDREIAKALIATSGNISAAARLLSQMNISAPLADRVLGSKTLIARSYVKKRIDCSPSLQALLENIRETLLDDAEANIAREVMVGKLEESKFVLTTLGRSRGYVRTIQTEDSDAAALAKRIQDARRATQTEQPPAATPPTLDGNAATKGQPLH